MENYRDFLIHELDARRVVNSNYSLRAYARDLEIQSSHLSKVLNGKAGISSEKSMQIADKIGLKGTERNVFLALVDKEHGKNKKTKLKAASYLKVSSKYSHIDAASFSFISDWEFYAVITAVRLDEFDGTFVWIQNHLGIEVCRLEEVLGILVDLNILSFSKGVYRSEKYDFETESDIPSIALRKAHKQNLMLAIKAIDLYDIDQREFNSMTMAIDIKKIPEAKKRIDRFIKEMCNFLESGEKNTVVNINLQLHPLTIDKELK